MARRVRHVIVGLLMVLAIAFTIVVFLLLPVLYFWKPEAKL